MMAEINPNTSENQRILDQLVHREVLHCVSYLMDHFAKNPESLDGSDYSYDEVLDLCRQQADPKEAFYEEGYELVKDTGGISYAVTRDIATWHLKIILDDYDRGKYATLDEAKDEFLKENGEEVRDPEDSQAICDVLDIDVAEHDSEVFEHWAVSKWFAEKLQAHGETVGQLFDFHIWGRATTGQAISMNSVVVEIALEMEILEGQRNSWAK